MKGRQMRISEIINTLQKIHDRSGDLNVVVCCGGELEPDVLVGIEPRQDQKGSLVVIYGGDSIGMEADHVGSTLS